MSYEGISHKRDSKIGFNSVLFVMINGHYLTLKSCLVILKDSSTCQRLAYWPRSSSLLSSLLLGGFYIPIASKATIMKWIFVSVFMVLFIVLLFLLLKVHKAMRIKKNTVRIQLLDD